MFVITVFLAFFSSCNFEEKYSDSEIIYWEQFGEPIHLKSDSLYLEDPPLLCMDMCFMDKYFVAFSSNEEYQGHLYDKETGEKMSSFLSFGSGPDEILNVNFISIKDSSISVSDKMQMSFLNLSFNLSSNDYIPTIKKQVMDEPFGNIANLDEKGYVITALNPESLRLSFLTNNGEVIKTVSSYPSIKNRKLTKLEKLEGFVSTMIVNYDKGKIYLFYKRTDLIEIYDLEGNLIKRQHGPDLFFPHIVEQHFDEGIMNASFILEKTKDAYLRPYLVNDKIYVLYSGASYISSRVPERNILLVFDEDCNPLKKYILSEHLWAFAVDLSEDNIYGVNYEFDFIKYDLTNILY